MDTTGWKEFATEAIRYWEPHRVIYNAVLATVIVVYFALGYPASKQALTVDEALVVFLLAVLANVAYCAVYIVDIFVQASGFREGWRKYRWIVFAVGVAFAAVITRFFAIGMFSSRQ